MFFKKKKEEFQDINGLGGSMQPLNPMQGMPDMNNSSGMEPVPGLDQAVSLDMPPQNDSAQSGIPPAPNMSNQDINNGNINSEVPVQAPFQPGELPEFNNPQPSQTQSMEQAPVQPSQSNELPSFEKEGDNIDLLVPTPPPNLLQRKEFTVNGLEEVEREFKSINPVDNFNFEKKQTSSKKPIFIKVENYEVTLKNIISMKNDAKEFSEVMFRIENLNDSQNSKFNSLQSQVEDIQRKLIFIDNLIFEV